MHIDTDFNCDHAVFCTERPTVGQCDRCQKISLYEEECASDGGSFKDMPRCVLELVDGHLVCADCGTEWEPVPEGMRLIKACKGDQ
jgi:hypothetical protein